MKLKNNVNHMINKEENDDDDIKFKKRKEKRNAKHKKLYAT